MSWLLDTRKNQDPPSNVARFVEYANLVGAVERTLEVTLKDHGGSTGRSVVDVWVKSEVEEIDLYDGPRGLELELRTNDGRLVNIALPLSFERFCALMAGAESHLAEIRYEAEPPPAPVIPIIPFPHAPA